ncbi:MAG: pyridoxal phosphate-dependent aminotransferase [Gemmataceae bacterium]|nr:pyridoxal phosphate-dependent aminotransferase [Gemmataceae bacterium]MCI0739854.1 pyridoxal phosphate-dependent aminotransferase [Gemmataceae bacterium]
MLPISKMAAAVQPSATLAAGAKARALKAEGKTVFDFSLGEPDFNTPKHICDAGYKAMLDGLTHYTPAAGVPELRKAIVNFYKKTYGLEVSPEQVIVSNGAKHSLHNALAAMVGPGDEVIIPTPYWVSYSDLVQMTGASFKLVPTTEANGWRMSPAQLKAALSPRSRLLMLNSPSNPTGCVYTRQELEALADVVLQSDLGVISDEIYEKLVYGSAKATCFATLRPGLAERTVTISGVSKSYAMTGWRMGWSVGPLHVVKAMGNVQSQETSNPSSISQYATLAALEGEQQCVEDMRREFEARRELICRRLNELPKIKCPVPEGAFYAFFNVSAHFGRTLGGKKITDSTSFCAAALETAHVNLVQGSAFGCEGYVRLSFATSREQINQGVDRLADFLK